MIIAAALPARAAHQLVSPGLDKIQTAITAAALHGFQTSSLPDSVLLRDGTYTFTASSGALIFDSGFNSNTCTGMVVTSLHTNGATVVCPNTGTLIYGGDAANVTICNMTWAVTSGGPGAWLRDLSGSAYAGWTFADLSLGAMGTGIHTTPFLISAATGAGITFKNLTTTSAFNAAYVIFLTGPGAPAATSRTNLDLLIENVDARLHTTSSLSTAIYLGNVWDVRVRRLKVDDPTDAGLKVDATTADSAATKIGAVSTCRKIYISDVWVRRATNIGVHVGNTDGHDVHPNWPRSMTNHVYMDNIRVEGTLTGYGIEYENLVSDCSLHHFFVLDCVNYGVALAEDTEKIQVTGGYINGITGSNSAGIITSCGQQNEIANNVIRNCDYGIKIQSNASFIIVPNRNIIRGNTIDGTKYAYGINLAAAMPSGVTANMLGPNTITTPTVAFASDHVGGSRTQAQFEGDYPTNIDHSDSVVGSAFPQGTPTESANAIAGTTGMTQRDALAIAALIARAGWTVFP